MTICLSKVLSIKATGGERLILGYVEADTVSHYGSSASGEFISSLTVTDLFSGWTENIVIWTKSAINTKTGHANSIDDLELCILLNPLTCHFVLIIILSPVKVV